MSARPFLFHEQWAECIRNQQPVGLSASLQDRHAAGKPDYIGQEREDEEAGELYKSKQENTGMTDVFVIRYSLFFGYLGVS